MIGILTLGLFVFVSLVVVFGPSVALMTFGMNRVHGISYFFCLCGALTWIMVSALGLITLACKSGWFS